MPVTPLERVQRQVAAMNGLYAKGPWTTEFFQWVDQSLTVLRAVFGDDSVEARAFLEAAGDDVHDPAAVMIPIHTDRGTHARMRRCSAVLDTAAGKLRRALAV